MTDENIQILSISFKILNISITIFNIFIQCLAISTRNYYILIHKFRYKILSPNIAVLSFSVKRASFRIMKIASWRGIRLNRALD